MTKATVIDVRSTTSIVVAPRQIIFIDRQVPDYRVLKAGIVPGIETVILDLDRDGVSQITEVLARYRGLTAIHIVSHGTSGSLQLGNGYVDLDNLASYIDSLRAWSKSVTVGAEILLYGCEVAQGERGATFVWWLRELTQTRVIAKATKTGNARLGGDWNLAASVPLAFTAGVMAQYQGVLADFPGTSGNDNLTGTSGDDTITGLAGNDTLSGLDGNDTIDGGGGLDIIAGGNGDDILDPGTSDAGIGNVDSVDGGAGTDTLVLDYSGKNYTGGLTIVSQNINATTNAVSGDVYAQFGVNTNFVDRVQYNNVERFNINGTNQNDSIAGGNLNDVLNGGAGDDTLNGYTGVDIIDGGVGNDTAIVDISSSASASNIDLANAANTLANGTQLINIEAVNIKLGSSNDTVIGSLAGNFNDTVDAGAGNDIVDVKNGNNVVIGGTGNDTITAGSGADNLSGGDDNDTINAGGGLDIVAGGAGDDILNPGTSDAGIGNVDSVDGGVGTDTLVLDYSGRSYVGGLTIVSQNINATTNAVSGDVYAQFGGNTNFVDRVQYTNVEKFDITGTDRNDNIAGGNLNDILIGGEGADTITGNGGNDILIGVDFTPVNTGQDRIDTLTGGAGSDGFILGGSGKVFYSLATTSDYANITDFDPAVDFIELANGFTYSIATSGLPAGISGVGLFVDRSGTPDLIAVFAGAAIGSFDLNNTSQFRRVNDIKVVATDPSAREVASGTADPGRFTITRYGDTSAAVTVNYSIATTATDGVDFTSLPGTVSFAAGQSIATIDLNAIDDVISEGLENVKLTLEAGTGYSLSRDRAFNTATVDINDNDVLPTISIADVAVNENAGTVTFTLSLNRASNKSIAVDYATADSGARVSDADYVATKGTAIFQAGSLSTTVTVQILDDLKVEGNEQFILDLSNPVNAAIVFNPAKGTTGGLATINNDDAIINIVSIVANDATAAETTTNDLANPGQFTFTRTGDLARALTVDFFQSNGTAANNQDYAKIGRAITFAAGQDTVTLDINVLDDFIAEGDEAVTLLLAFPNNKPYTLGTNDTATVTIADNEGTPTLRVRSIEQVEGTTATFVLELSRVTNRNVTVNYQAVNGTAVNSTDYFLPSGTATILAGQLSTTLNVPFSSDAVSENPETFFLDLSNITNATLGTTRATGTIANDDLPQISIAAIVSNAAEKLTSETQSPGVVRISRQGDTSKDLTINFTATGTALNNTDYRILANNELLNNAVTLRAGESSLDLTLEILDDSFVDAAEVATINLASGFGYTLGTTTTASTNIADNDAPPVVQVEKIQDATEGGSQGQFRLTRVGNTSSAIAVNYVLSGTATNFSDYVKNAPFQVSLGVGQTTATVDIATLDDNIFEGTETVVLTVAAGTNYTPSTTAASASLNIIDNDAQPTISINDVSIVEGNSGSTSATFTLTLNRASTQTISVDVASADGTATTADNDYIAVAPRTITFNPGETSKTVSVTVNGDLNTEPNETFSVNLTNPVNATIADASGIGTIVADDTTVSIASVADGNETPGNPVQFQLVRSGDLRNALNVSYTLSGTATRGTDYTLSSNSVTFAAGVDSVIVNGTVTNDNLSEGATPETVVMTLNSSASYALGTASATANIVDNDGVPGINIVATRNITEGSSGTNNGTIAVTLTNASTQTVTVDYTTTNVAYTATAGVDYTPTSGTLTFAPGQTSQNIIVPIGALADYNRAIALDPEYALFHLNRGFLKQEKLNDSQGALADYNRAIALAPQDARVYINRGILKARKLNDSQGALADYDRAIALNPQYDKAYNNRGILKDRKLNDSQGALADYDRAIILNPQYDKAYYNRGLLKGSKLNDKAGAIQDFRQAAKLFRSQGQTQNLQQTIDILRRLGTTE